MIVCVQVVVMLLVNVIFSVLVFFFFFMFFFFFQAEDGIRDLVRSRGLGDVYKRQCCFCDVRGNGAVSVITPFAATATTPATPAATGLILSLIHI